MTESDDPGRWKITSSVVTQPLEVRSPHGEQRTGRRGPPDAERKPREAIFGLNDVMVSYNKKPAVRGVSFDIGKNEITALIGPSGCGKSTLIRCLNRMNDLIPGATVDGEVLYHGQNLYAPQVDAVEVRKRIGMVFQKPNPFPKSIYDNIAFGPRVLGMKGNMDEIVESALTQRGALGRGQGPPQDERLRHVRRPAAAPLHRARLAVEPDVILMDEPCSALDPISTGKIEDLMMELKDDYSIVIVTHNMQQAARVSDKTAFFTVELSDDEHRTGRVVEFDDTEKIFTNPDDPRTEAYVTGKVG